MLTKVPRDKSQITVSMVKDRLGIGMDKGFALYQVGPKFHANWCARFQQAVPAPQAKGGPCVKCRCGDREYVEIVWLMWKGRGAGIASVLLLNM